MRLYRCWLRWTEKRSFPGVEPWPLDLQPATNSHVLQICLVVVLASLYMNWMWDWFSERCCHSGVIPNLLSNCPRLFLFVCFVSFYLGFVVSSYLLLLCVILFPCVCVCVSRLSFIWGGGGVFFCCCCLSFLFLFSLYIYFPPYFMFNAMHCSILEWIILTFSSHCIYGNVLATYTTAHT